VQARILVVDDEVPLAEAVADYLTARGNSVETAFDVDAALALLGRSSFDLALVDLRLPGSSGLELFRRMQELGYEEPVILISAYGTFEDAVEAMRLGAADFLRKPFDLAEVEIRARRVFEEGRRRRELEYLRGRGERGEGDGLVGSHPVFETLLEDVERIARSVSSVPPSDRPPVLVSGETGVGKEIVARHLHRMAGGEERPFVDVACMTLQPSLIGSELFGHERGAFTGATGARRGLFEAASGGTLFLDEIGHLPIDLQAKLLTAIEEKTIRRLGAPDVRHVDVWVMTASNSDLQGLVERGELRSDLYYRVSAIELRVPPLRERGDDIVLLAEHFLRQLAAKYRRETPRLGDEARRILLRYRWPGNIRELRNLMERVIVRSDRRELSGCDLLRVEPGLETEPPRRDSDSLRIDPTTGRLTATLPEEGIPLDRVEDELLRQAFERTDGNLSAAARLLGLSRERFRTRWNSSRRRGEELPVATAPEE